MAQLSRQTPRAFKPVVVVFLIIPNQDWSDHTSSQFLNQMILPRFGIPYFLDLKKKKEEILYPVFQF